MNIEMLPVYQALRSGGSSENAARDAVNAIEQEIERKVSEKVAAALQLQRERDPDILWYVLALLGVALASGLIAAATVSQLPGVAH